MILFNITNNFFISCHPALGAGSRAARNVGVFVPRPRGKHGVTKLVFVL